MTKLIIQIVKLLMVCTLCIGGVIAAPLSSRINLYGGTVAPKSSLIISTNILLSEVAYHVSCDVDQDNVNVDPATIVLQSPKFAWLFPGKYQFRNTSTGVQIALKNIDPREPHMKVLMTGIYSSKSIKIINADLTNSVVFSNCFAEAGT